MVIGNTLSQLCGYRKCCMSVDKVGDRPDKHPGKNTKCEATINFQLENIVCKDRSTREDREK